MANHVRRQIREAAATALTSLTTTGANVFQSRTHELQDADLPGLRIYTNDEAIDKLQEQGDQLRTIQLVVEGCAKASSNLDDTLDTIIKEVEVALAGNQTIGGAKYVDLAEIEIDMEGEAEKECGVARMTFEVVVLTDMAAPDVAL
jgi:hypothetical protein